MMTYKATNFARLCSRFIMPAYIKSELNNIEFSSTITFAKYQNYYYAILAAHSLNGDISCIENIGFFSIDGEFISIYSQSKYFIFDKEKDIIIFNTNIPIENRWHFSLEEETSDFECRYASWIGFPQKKAIRQYHRTRSSPEHIKKAISTLPDGMPLINNAKFLSINNKKVIYYGYDFIDLEFINENVSYEQEGTKTQGYSPRGMSGGAIFFRKPNIDVKGDCLLFPNPNVLIYLAGIGLSYDKNIIRGASRRVIIDLLLSDGNKILCK